MPPIPQQTQREARSTQLPTPRLNPSRPEQGLDLGNVVDVIGQQIEKRKYKANQIATLAADSALAKLETKLLYDPETGALTKKGKESFTTPEETMARWKEGVGELEAGLSNDDQRLSFRERVIAREADLDRVVQRHVSGEIEAYEKSEVDGYITNERTAAMANPMDADRVEVSVQRQLAALRDYAEGKLPEETITAMANDITSKTYAGVIEIMLAQDQDERAGQYFNEVKEFIHGAEAVAIQKALDEGSLRGKSQRTSDTLVGKHATQQEALEAMREMQLEPKLRDMVEDRVVRHFALQKQMKDQMLDDLYTQATNLIDAQPGTPARDLIPPADYAKLPLSHRNALDARSQDNIRNNDKIWLDFLALPPTDINKMSRATFEIGYWSHFDQAHRNRAEQLWLSTRDLKTPDPQLTSAMTFRDRVDNAIRTSGFVGIDADKPIGDFTKEERTFYAWFEQEAAKSLEQFELTQLGGKRRATGEEVQKIIDELAFTKIYSKGGFFTPERRKLMAALVPDDYGQVYYKPEDIPVEAKNAIENKFRTMGRRITDKKTGRLYAAFIIDGRPWDQQIADDSSVLNSILRER